MKSVDDEYVSSHTSASALTVLVEEDNIATGEVDGVSGTQSGHYTWSLVINSSQRGNDAYSRRRQR